jgi:hypothetical protein
MGNILLTPNIIARESLMVLQNNMVLGGLVHKDYSAEFANVGDTITVRKPATFTVDEFDGTSIHVQDAKESGVPVKMDKHLDLSFRVTSKDLSLNIVDFSTQFLVPAMQAFAQDVDSRLASLYVDIPYISGTAGTTPNSVSSITGVRKVMNDNKVPMQGRNLVLDTAADAKLLELDTFNRVDASGTNTALQEAQLGRKLGFDTYMDQNIKKHTKGSLAAATAPKVASAVDVDARIATFNDTALTGTIKKGDIFTVAGDSQTYVVTADATAAGNALAVSFYPAAKVGWAANAVVTIVNTHSANLAFYRNAFAMVTRQLALPMGGNNASYINYNGLGLRVVMGYDMQSKSDIVSIDLLCGFKTLMPELACRLLG